MVLPILSHRPLSLCLRLNSALSRWRPYFCWLLPLPNWVGELQALSSIVTFVAGDDCLSYIPQLVTKSESLTCSFPRSFLVTSLADFAAGLAYDLLLCPVRALRLCLLRAMSLYTGRHRLFVSPRRPARPFLRTRCRSFGGGHCCCSGGWTSGWIPPGSISPQRVHLCRIPPSLVGCLFPCPATWASSSVFYYCYLSDIQHEFDGLLSLGHFVAAGSRIG